MMKKNKIRSPNKSLRTLLMFWLLAFAVVPLAFITGYSYINYEEAIDLELVQRLIGNKREIKGIFQDFYKDLVKRNELHASDRQLIYFLTSNNINQARELSQKWMRNSFVNHLSIFNREGRMEIALARDENNGVLRQSKFERGDVFLSEQMVQKVGNNVQITITDFTSDGSLELVMFSKIQTSNGSLLGYIEEILRIDPGFIQKLKSRLGIEIAFFSKSGDRIVASHDDLRHYRQGYFLEKYNDTNGNLFSVDIREIPYGVMIQSIDWGNDTFYAMVAASKQATQKVLSKVNYAFFSVVGTIVFLLVILSYILSRILLQPLNNLVDRVQNIDFDELPQKLPETVENELGILTISFNEMAKRVYDAQKNLKDNIKKLEIANEEIRNTQAKLVHTAKMASLGQLVAGIAHELNNPISFIYSNVAYLRDYTDRLVQLVEIGKNSPDRLPEEQEKLEFEYIKGDLPKLIKSCEEGAKRTRDIVLGLRSFSRLEEAKLKEVNVHECIESTLALLSGELKSRIKINKNFSELPKITCYPSELNQVFMNIFSNAIHAISDQGEITIATLKLDADRISVSIRDTGHGMSEETREHLFDPFFTTKDVNSGTGLGMSITYGIIKKHNGEIHVNSEMNKGTEFIINLPINLQA